MPPDASLLAFVHDLRHQIAQESDHARQQVKKIWNAPLPERVKQGKAIQGARVASFTGQWANLDLPDHEALFREGDLLIWTENGNPSLERRAELVLEEERDGHFLCRIRKGKELLPMGAVGVLDFGFADLSDQLNQALDKALESTKGREKILPLLEGNGPAPTFDPGKEEEARKLAKQEGLNEAQTDALAFSWSTDLAFLVQGPPGTGKTAVLSLLACMAARAGLRVLVTGLTHRGIDNAMAAIHRSDSLLNVARIGAPYARNIGVPTWDNFTECPWADTSDGFIVGATPYCLQNARLGGIEFDFALFDEASQVTLPLAIMGMNGAKRWIFFGDHQQLPPVLPTLEGRDLLAASVFGRLIDRDFDQMLDVTYRLCDTLCRWPSETFYQGKLVASESAARRRLRLNQTSRHDLCAQALDPAIPLVHLDLEDAQATSSSSLEADWTARLVERALQGGVPASEIAVVTPFRRQNRLIRNRLSRIPGAQSVAVDTVERMQGQERDLVIVSLTSGNDAFVERLAEFYFQPQRLNVAATRARSKLILVGRGDWSELFERRHDLEGHGQNLSNLLTRAHRLSPMQESTWQS